MKLSVLAVLATVFGLLLAKPCPVEAQRASIQASITILAPQVQPSVQVVAPLVDGERRPAVVVEGPQRWGVRIQVAGEELLLPMEARDGRSRVDLPAAIVAAAARRSSTEHTPIRVVLAVN
jgi:hypothetical protein